MFITLSRRSRFSAPKSASIAALATAMAFQAAPALADSSAGSLVPPVVPVLGAPADYLVPDTSCLAAPSRPECPAITEAYYSAPVGLSTPQASQEVPVAADDVDAAELQAAYTSYFPTSAATYGNITEEEYGACEVNATTPKSDQRTVSITSSHTCPGRSVKYQKVVANIQRYQRNTGWTQLANGSDSANGPGWIVANASYNCNHSKQYAYRNHSYAEHTIAKAFGGTRTYSTWVDSTALTTSCNL